MLLAGLAVGGFVPAGAEGDDPGEQEVVAETTDTTTPPPPPPEEPPPPPPPEEEPGFGAFSVEDESTDERCPALGAETAETDRADFVAGESVELTGEGYSALCDVVIRVTQPDGSVVVVGDPDDPNFLPGSEPVTTDEVGALLYHHQPSGIEGEHTIEVVGRDDVVLATTTFVIAAPAVVESVVDERCEATGDETVATDEDDYPPWATVEITGDGYGESCDVVVRVTWPDGSVRMGDGTLEEGSDTVTTDEAGDLFLEYLLVTGLEGEYEVDVLGRDDVVLASTTFTDSHDGPADVCTTALTPDPSVNRTVGGSGNQYGDGTIGPLAVWVNSTAGNKTLDVQGNENVINGLAVSRGSISIEGEENQFQHGTQYGTDLDIPGNDNCFTPIPELKTDNPAGFPISATFADFEPGGSAADEAQATNQYFRCVGSTWTHDDPDPDEDIVKCSSSKITTEDDGTLPSGLYIAASVDIDNELSGTVTFAATEEFDVDDDLNFTSFSSNGVLFASNIIGDDAINVSGDRSSFNGHVVAFRGEISISGDRNIFTCAIMGETVKIHGDEHQITGGLCGQPPPGFGSLEVLKVVDGTGSPDPNAEFEITVACDDDDFDAVFTFDASGALDPPTQDNPITDIPVGTECTVTETESEGADAVTYDPHGDEPTDPPTVTITTDGQEIVVTVTNTFDGFGSLEVVKVVDGTGSPASDAEFTIEVDCDDDAFDETFTFDANGDQTSANDNPITDIPVDTECTVTETGDGGADAVTYDPDGGTPSDPPTVTITSDGQEIVVTVTNTFDAPELGSVAVQKVTEGDVGTGTQFVVSVDCDGLAPVLLTFTAPGDLGPKQVNDIPVGTDCDVEETQTGGATLVTYVPSGAGGELDPPTVTVGQTVQLVTVTNFFPAGEATGVVDVTKAVEGTPPDGTTYEVRVFCTDGTDETLHFGANGGSQSVTGIRLPTSCTVEETGQGGASSVTYTPEDTTFVLTVESPERALTVTNVFDPQTVLVGGVDVTRPPETRGALAFTGSPIAWLVLVAVLLLGSGAGLTVAARRRKRSMAA